ncbi:helix-turn-helix domain-containing protein, partial [Kurthia zopfii]
MEQLKAYKFRIYPTEEQEIFFAKTFGCVRINVNTNMYISACIKMYRFTHFLYLNNLLFGK